MKQTANLKLNKPDIQDYVKVSDLNENADILDEAINQINSTLNKKLSKSTSIAKIIISSEVNNDDGEEDGTILLHLEEV